jgi:hypothetical protein
MLDSPENTIKHGIPKVDQGTRYGNYVPEQGQREKLD